MADLNVEIDGKAIQVPAGSTVMDAAHRIDAYIPHFCYHKKLSIAANCRMCLVQIEKAPKPMPACATPVTEGMKVFTASDQAKKAQQGVMEFLLINHPLDCPICDQGGECQLQDLAVGYGKSESRYQEEKRVVFHKNVGPLISMQEMSRCIHCTRCVRFGQEIAGIMELGMAGRGEHSEIQTFVGRSVSSELSGNMIDVCPVGALTSKPFRYSARTWELQRKRSISPHDGLGTNLTVQTKQNKVMRVLPYENEAINECWISDRDRFSYEGINAEDRLTTPMIKQGGQWQQATWAQAMEYVAHAFSDVKSRNGAESVGILASPTSTLEELFLLRKFGDALGASVDARPRYIDPALDAASGRSPTLGVKISEIAALDRVLIVGSSLRQEQPLLAARIRQAAKKGCQVSYINPIDTDPLMAVRAKAIVAPSQIAATIRQITSEVRAAGSESSQTSSETLALAKSLASGKNVAIFIGELALSSAHAAEIEDAVAALAASCSAKFGRFAAAGNSVGATLAGAIGTLSTEFARTPKQAVMLWGLEPEYDCAGGSDLVAALEKAATVVACVTHKTAAQDYADVMLPIASFTETSGTYVNCEGLPQSMQACVSPLGDARPGWKVLRVLSELLGAKDVAFDSSEQVRDACLAAAASARDSARAQSSATAPTRGEIERIVERPIYQSDMLVRRGESLQKAELSKIPAAQISTFLAEKIFENGISGRVKFAQGDGACVVDAVVDPSLPSNCVRIPGGVLASVSLGAQDQPLRMERA